MKTIPWVIVSVALGACAATTGTDDGEGAPDGTGGTTSAGGASASGASGVGGTSVAGSGAGGATSDSGSTGTGGANAGTGGAGGVGGASGGGIVIDATPGGACAEDIFLIDREGGLHSFNPATTTFRDIATVTCNGQMLAANSMAISRQGIAYVNTRIGRVFAVDVNTGRCSNTNYVTGTAGFDTFGMGFVSNTAGSEDETLFIHDNQLATLNLGAMSIAEIGAATPADERAELTGTGDARLFAYITSTPPRISQLDKQTGAETQSWTLTGLETGRGFAVSFWGGDFFVFTGVGITGEQTRVSRFDPDTGTLTQVTTIPDYGVVGAGVTTCAPLR